MPVGESKLNCRKEHIELLKKHLNNCQNFLVIGFSGYDEDILKLLDEKEGGFGSVYFVSSSEQSATEAVKNFMNFGKLSGKLQTHIDYYSGNGFDEFIRSSESLNKFLKQIQ